MKIYIFLNYNLIPYLLDAAEYCFAYILLLFTITSRVTLRHAQQLFEHS